VTLDEAVPPAGGVTGLVPKITVMPLGKPELESETLEAKLPTDWIVMADEAS
jgi:hypothetical protein